MDLGIRRGHRDYEYSWLLRLLQLLSNEDKATAGLVADEFPGPRFRAHSTEREQNLLKGQNTVRASEVT